MSELMENMRIVNDQMEIIDVDEIDYEGFQVVRGEFFAHTYEPCFIFNNNKIYVNSACVRKMPDTQFIQILVNPEEKKLAIRPTDESVKDSFRWRSAGAKPKPKQITCKIFYAKICTLMGWSFNNRYRLLGKLIHSNGEYLFMFDLNNAEVFIRKEIDGKTKTSRTPVYPDEWKNQFGISVKEHQENLQVNIFNGYAVFGIQDKKQEERHD